MKPIPQILYDRARRLAEVHPLGVVAELIGKSKGQVSVMKARNWQAADYACRRRPVPSDFALLARRMTQRQLCAHYRAGPPAVRRWMREKAPRPSWRGIALRKENRR